MKESTQSEWNNETRKVAHSFLLALTRFPFLICLVVTEELFRYTKELSINPFVE